MRANRLVVLACAAICLASVARGDDAEALRFFETRIRPVLVRSCYECHSHAADEPEGGLLLDSRAGTRRGGETGPAVVPGNVDASLIVSALRHDGLEMPPDRKLSDKIVADFVRWISDGAVDPRDTPPSGEDAAEAAWLEQFAERARWWSLQPIERGDRPNAGRLLGWTRTSIDAFVAAKLSEADLFPAPVADRRTLARRMSFVLLGLPPNPRDVQTFVEDSSPLAYERLVDRLLASPHFGERWARHWMDVVRYTDTYGYEWDVPAKGAWRYRDYLIRAFNDDVPFDQLVREQIAGDQLPAPRLNAIDRINESLIGTMFWQMGEKRHGDSSEFNGIHQEMLDNKIDAFSKAFQGTTIACARCHNHKLDAISQEEYYALGGMLMSSRWVTNTADLDERNAEVIDELRQIKADLASQIGQLWMAQFKEVDTASMREFVIAEQQRLAKATKKPDWDDPLYVWTKLVGGASDATSFSEGWKAVATEFAAESQKRRTENAAHFKVVADFREGVPDGWSVDGTGLQQRAACGEILVALDGDQAIQRVVPGGLYTNLYSPRMNGAVRSPYLREYMQGHISYEVCGGDFSSHRLVIDNAFLTEKQRYLNQDRLQWILNWTHNPAGDRRNFIEIVTKTSNPNFPPRVGLGGVTLTADQITDPTSWFGITRVVVHNAPFTPKDELDRFRSFYAGSPNNFEEAVLHWSKWLQRAVLAWCRGEANGGDVALINWMLSKDLLKNSSEESTTLRQLVDQYRRVEKRIEAAWTVNGMADLDAGFDYRLNIRGDYDELGNAVPRRYLSVLSSPKPESAAAAEAADQVRRSGRDELARIVASSENPLTARVFVNRLWQWVYGTGLVTTPNDFGHLGDRPVHPALLDDLAHRFVDEGWSVKRLVRTMIVSQTWRQSGRTGERARRLDPDNRLWHHMPMRRLEAEAIRDAILSVSGRLDARLYGQPIDPFRANEDPQKRLFCGPLDGNGRRAIYTKVTIMEPARFMALFNQPEPKISTGKRDITNTPAQSLALLNDPFVIEQSNVWATELVSNGDIRMRLSSMFERAFGRSPTPAEQQRWMAAARDFAAHYNSDTVSDQRVWRDLAHAFLNTKEFLYVR